VRRSLGFTLTDTLDDLISEHRIDPQLAMKVLANFDRAIAETLQDKVKARLTFKVSYVVFLQSRFDIFSDGLWL
jgi:transcription initiation factor TFIIA small subunit